jgi:hypothetical protein
LKAGRVTTATVVDHIEPYKGDEEVFLIRDGEKISYKDV